MSRMKVWVVIAVLLCVAAAAGWRLVRLPATRRPLGTPQPIVVHAKGPFLDDRLRGALLAELQPVALANCELKRFGEANDGGYVLCANLLGSVQAGYSYGISGYDGWGCQVSRELKIKVHQYDCFDLAKPVCRGGTTTFHAECVAGEPSTNDDRLFDTPERQIARNGDARRQLVVKIDVEGAEWDTFLETPDSVFDQIDQLAIEFHGANRQRYADAIAKLKRHFYVANLHFNNYSCTAGLEPFPAWAYEVLLVSKRLAVPDPSGKRPDLSAVNAPNNPNFPDCQ